jgi:hypothetical protein
MYCLQQVSYMLSPYETCCEASDYVHPHISSYGFVLKGLNATELYKSSKFGRICAILQILPVPTQSQFARADINEP